MKTLKERIAIEQALLDGKNIQSIRLYSDKAEFWRNFSVEPDTYIFNWGDFDFRIKPEPIEFWVNIYNESITTTAFRDKEAAENCRSFKMDYIKTIKVREVME